MGAKGIYISQEMGVLMGEGNQQEDREIGMKSKGTEQPSEYTVLKCCNKIHYCIHANKKTTDIK